MKRYTVKRYCSDDFALWNDFISQATNATFLFDRNFMEYHADRFQDFSLLVFEEDILQAVVPANCKDNQIFSHQGLTYGGFVFRNEFPIGQIETVLSETFSFLQSQGFVKCEIKAMLPFYAPDFHAEIQQVLSDKQAKITAQKMNLAIDFRTEYSISKSKLKHYRRLQSEGLVVKKEADCTIFWQEVLEPLLLEKYQTKPLHSLAEINSLQSKFPNHIEQYNLYRDGKILAGITLFKTATVIKSQYGATTENGKKFRALDYLFLYLIDSFKADYDYFDMGTVDDNSELGYNEGLLNQKKELGCSVYSQNIFQIAL
ncbi:hypothetical protein GCM10022386_02430 [Flavobacterium cheonhonense]|uniref:FemAB family protein n=1 Tax=Flavobacterium cheonhonense TaxID=706185 RepID=A0ABP7T9I7_9FLAO|nr:FemAB family protein [Flavobacterium cheonhonense]